MHVDVVPRRLTVQPTAPGELLVTVTNTTEVIGGYAIRVLGADPSWVRVDDPSPRLFPGESVTTRVSLQLPDGVPAGDRPVAVEVADLGDPTAVALEEAVLEVPAAPRTSVELDPATVTAGRTATYSATVRNDGNTFRFVQVRAVDPEARTTFAFRPAELHLSPGASAVVALTASARRPFVGDAALRPFELRLDDPQGTPPAPDAPPAAVGMFVQKPLFSRGALGLLGLLVAITVFATVITLALGSVVDRSAADRDLALQVAQAREQAATTGRAAVAGSVIELTTGAPLAGVSVEAFAADDTSEALVTTATDESGRFAVDKLPAGDFLVRVRGAGFAEVWYPTAAAPGDATPVAVEDGETVEDLVVVVGGVPAAVSGSVTGDDVAGGVVRVEMPLDAPPLAGQVANEPGAPTGTDATTDGALVRSVPVGSDGTFSVEDLPSPAVYDLVVTKAGYATTTQRLDLAAGEAREGVELSLLVGDGSIAGRVDGPDGPVGGATIAATAGQTRVETVSLTQDDVGSFVLRGLPTPGSYTVVVSADGYATATLTLTLTPGQELTGVAVVLGRDQGALAGTVVVPGGDAGGVTVTVSDGATTLQTVTRSTDPAGTWHLGGLRVPGDYTVTFSRADLESQVLSVSLDGFGTVTSGAAAAGSVDVSLRSATASLSGRVAQTRGAGTEQPAGNVVVTVSSGTVERVVTTASTPAADVGRYTVENLPPGTYTVTFARSGTRTTSEIVVLGAAEARTLSPVLVAPARLGGTVRTAEGQPLAGRAVLLYPASEYGTSAPARAQTTTRPDGTYVLEDVAAPEHYVVEVRAAGGPGGSGAGAVLGASAPFTLDASEDRTVDVVAEDTGTGTRTGTARREAP